jgi:hypothetical protein
MVVIKKTVTATWSETVTYEKEIEIEEGKEDQWFEAFEQQYKQTDWRNKFVEVEHRQLLSMDPAPDHWVTKTCSNCIWWGSPETKLCYRVPATEDQPYPKKNPEDTCKYFDKYPWKDVV